MQIDMLSFLLGWRSARGMVFICNLLQALYSTRVQCTDSTCRLASTPAAWRTTSLTACIRSYLIFSSAKAINIDGRAESLRGRYACPISNWGPRCWTRTHKHSAAALRTDQSGLLNAFKMPDDAPKQLGPPSCPMKSGRYGATDAVWLTARPPSCCWSSGLTCANAAMRAACDYHLLL